MAVGMSVRVEGTEQLVRLAKAVKAAGDANLRKEMLRGLRTTAKKAIPDLKASALDVLPASGGLAALVAGAKYTSRTKTTGKSAGIRIVAAQKGHDIEATNRGMLRHPVYGNRSNWVLQSIEPGWWDRGAEKAGPQVRVDLLNIMQDIAQKIDRSV